MPQIQNSFVKRFILTFAILSTLLFSCDNEGNVASPPIDSTNANGTAPVKYSNGGSNESTPGNTALPDENKNQDKVNTPNGDSLPFNRK